MDLSGVSPPQTRVVTPASGVDGWDTEEHSMAEWFHIIVLLTGKWGFFCEY